MTIEQYEKLKNDWFPGELRITTLEDAEELHEVFIEFRTYLALNKGFDTQPHYRGEQFHSWDIRPGLFRPPLMHLSGAEGRGMEERGANRFEEIIDEHYGPHALRRIYNHMTFGRNWDLLFQAQHAGVKTTLTDWSAKIYNPLFFATETSAAEDIEKSDAQLWWFMVPGHLIWGHSDLPDSFYEKNPFDLNEHLMINPAIFLNDLRNRLFESRMFKQFGRFFISPNALCNEPVNLQPDLTPFLTRIRIPADRKLPIREQLAERGMSRQTVYVDEPPELRALMEQLNNEIFIP